MVKIDNNSKKYLTEELTTTAPAIDYTNNDEPEYPILKSPQYLRVTELLTEHDWDIDTRVIRKNMVIITKGNDRFLLCLFCGNEDYNRDDCGWLADEERFQGEDPLWFSERAHTLSPVYSVNQCVANLYLELSYIYHPIVIMMYPHYIFNAEDMLDIWGDTPIVSIERFCQFIESDLTTRQKNKHPTPIA